MSLDQRAMRYIATTASLDALPASGEPGSASADLRPPRRFGGRSSADQRSSSANFWHASADPRASTLVTIGASLVLSSTGGAGLPANDEAPELEE